MVTAQSTQPSRHQSFGLGSLAARLRRWALPLVFGGVAASAGLGLVLAQDFDGAPRPSIVAGTQDASPSAPRTKLKTSTIKLPIEINDTVRGQFQEVHIWVKEGAGGAWALKDRVPSTQLDYTFHAPQDGEYWFKLGTVDRGGRSSIVDISREVPDTIVVVDTQGSGPDLHNMAPPSSIDVRNLGDTPDGTNVQVMVRDNAADGAKLKFHYQTGNRQWQPLEAQPGRPDLFCIPAQAVLTGMVRITAPDPAGHLSTRELNLNQMATASFAGPGNGAASQPNKLATNLGTAQTVLVDPQEKIIYFPPPGQSGTVASPGQNPGNHGAKLTAGPGPGEKTLLERVEVVAKKPGNTMLIPNHPQGSPPPIDPIVYRTNQPLNPGTTEIVSAHDKDLVKGQGAPFRKDSVPINRHLVSVPRVVLDYQLDQVGASGVGRVDIYLTRDAGQSWQKIGDDPDKKSPLEVNLPGDGLFGLSLAVTNGRGFGGNPPQVGDSPDWWVEVDTSKPFAEITNVRTGSAEADGASVFISWTAKDKNLANEPINLFFAPTREGPWQPIAKGVHNEGQFRWVPGRDVGAQAFIRLVVTDMVGNSSTFETAQPVLLDDMSRPRARPVGLSPAVRPTPPVTILGNNN